ncbi:hypothetical protein DL96DRAFT_1704323 [Flagelloscypha sp. PMI_526]|nr:hypothetical protein DL96DRAFT_1704323 [Flagelloscypha sp. PMI_526]
MMSHHHILVLHPATPTLSPNISTPNHWIDAPVGLPRHNLVHPCVPASEIRRDIARLERVQDDRAESIMTRAKSVQRRSKIEARRSWCEAEFDEAFDPNVLDSVDLEVTPRTRQPLKQMRLVYVVPVIELNRNTLKYGIGYSTPSDLGLAFPLSIGFSKPATQIWHESPIVPASATATCCIDRGSSAIPEASNHPSMSISSHASDAAMDLDLPPSPALGPYRGPVRTSSSSTITSPTLRPSQNNNPIAPGKIWSSFSTTSFYRKRGSLVDTSKP